MPTSILLAVGANFAYVLQTFATKTGSGVPEWSVYLVPEVDDAD